MLTTEQLGMGLSVALPLIPLTNALFLLKRAIRNTPAHWFSLCASAMVFTFSALWLTKSLTQLRLLFAGGEPATVHAWLAEQVAGGPFLALSFLTLSGGFWVWLAWAQRLKSKR